MKYKISYFLLDKLFPRGNNCFITSKSAVIGYIEDVYERQGISGLETFIYVYSDAALENSCVPKIYTIEEFLAADLEDFKWYFS